MRYERPGIVRRDPIAGLLSPKQLSDVQNKGTAPSDVNIKDNVVPVVWPAQRSAYATPAIVRRDSIAGMLDGAAPSDVNTQPDFESDVNIKDNIVPVRW